MAGENKLSPLFGDMQTSSSSSSSPNSAPAYVHPAIGVGGTGNALPDKTGSILETLSAGAKTTFLKGDVRTSGQGDLLDSDINKSSVTPRSGQLLQEGASTAISETPNLTPVKVPERIEQDETSSVVAQNIQPLRENIPDPKLAQYLALDRVYQDMLRVDNHEKIRLQYAIRYTLLMFAIFLVFAWITSNRVIMFGFSEFVWLARIRDALFAVMAGLFSLTLWHGSVTWLNKKAFIITLRSFSIIFFVAILIALYII